MSIKRRTSARATVRSASAVIALTAIMLSTFGAVPAFAHQDPNDCESSGVTIQMTIYRQNGTTAIGGGTVQDDEPLVYQTTLSKPNGSCSFYGGQLSITTPDGQQTDVTPDGGIPCIGGTDPGCVSSVRSKPLGYIVRHGDENVTAASRRVIAKTNYGGGATHDGDPDGVGPTGSTTKSINVVHPDIHLKKTPDAQIIDAGDTASFTLAARNDGPGAAHDVTIDDDLPNGNGLSWSENPNRAECSISGLHLHCDAGTLAKNDTFSVTVEALTAEGNSGVLDNQACTATVSHETHGTASTGGDDNCDTGRITVNGPGLTITKTADDASVNTGESIGFTVDVGNDGPGLAKNVTLSDALPGGNNIDWSISPAFAGPGTCAITGVNPSQTLTCSFGNLAVAGAVSVHVTSATSDDSAGTYDNTAATKADNNHEITASATTEVLAPALTISKVADENVVSAEENIGFTVTVGNDGVGVAKNVTLDDPLPAGNGVSWSIDPAFGGPGTCAISGNAPTQTLACSFGDFSQGDSASVHISSATTEDSLGNYINLATADADNTPSVEATDSVVVEGPGLTITKTADDSTVNTGESIGFTVEVGNDGPGVAKNVTLSDLLPDGASIDWSISPAYAGPGSCSISGAAPAQTLNCSFGHLAKGASVSVHVSSETSDDSAGRYDNTATADSTNGPAVDASDSTTVLAPSLAITKTEDLPSVSTSEDIGFTVDVSNGGPGVAKAVTLSDPLPSGNGVDWSVSPAYTGPGTCAITGSAPNQTLDCSFGNMASGDATSVHVLSGTTDDSAGVYDNTAEADSTNGPAVQASASTTVLAPSLAIVKAADRGVVSTTESIGFQVGVSNGGPGKAFDVKLDDPLPGGNGVEWSIAPAYTGPGTCDVTGAAPAQTLSCSFGTMLPGDATSVHLVSSTTRASAATYKNTAKATAIIRREVSASAKIIVNPPKLSIRKTADAVEVRAGDQIGFTITVANAGPGTALATTLDDPLPGQSSINWSVDNYTGPGSCAITGAAPSQSVECAFGDLAARRSVTVHVVSATAHLCEGTYENTATTAAINDGPLDSSATLTVIADGLVISNTPDAAIAPTGRDIGYTVSLRNNGPDIAFRSVLSNPLPAGSGVTWSISPAYAGPGSCAVTGATGSQKLACSFGDLPDGAALQIHLSSPTTDDSFGSYLSTATARAQNNPFISAPATILVEGARLKLAKTDCQPVVAPGSTVTYEIGFANTGNKSAPGSTLTVTLPDGLKALDAQGATITGDTVKWNLGTLQAGQVGTKVLRAKVLGANGSTLLTTVKFTSGARTVITTITQTVSNAGASTRAASFGLSLDGLAGSQVWNKQASAAKAPTGNDARSGAMTSIDVVTYAKAATFAGSTSSTVDGLNATSTGKATAAEVDLLAGVITAGEVRGVSTSTAGVNGSSASSAGSYISDLRINGVQIGEITRNLEIEVRHPLNPSIVLARVVLQEEVSTVDALGASHGVNMIRVTVINPFAGLKPGAEIIVSHAESAASYPAGPGACGPASAAPREPAAPAGEPDLGVLPE